MIKNKIIIVSFFIILASCGFKVVNKNEQINFYISEIKTSGDKRISYKIKNKLSYFDDKNKKNIKLELETKKIKSVKEKNIKNEITKYNLQILTEVKVIDDSGEISSTFSISKNGNISVENQHSKTLDNEKKLIEDLSDQVSKSIISELIIKI
jgi:hypothetical protein|tara:strand:+ start:3311 stop:3769 length:459 start_codon:yes stop_codon:yes gene_type:complete